MGLLTPCSVPREGFLYTMIVPGEGFAPFKPCPVVCSGRMVLDEIDTCIIIQLKFLRSFLLINLCCQTGVCKFEEIPTSLFNH